MALRMISEKCRVRSEQNALAAGSGAKIREAWLAWPECNGGKADEEKSQ